MSRMEKLYQEDFIDKSSLEITHNIGRSYLGGVRLVVDAEARNELIVKVQPSKVNPKNVLLVELSEVCSGTLQILGADYVRVGEATASEAATSLLFGQDNAKGGSSEKQETTKDTDWAKKMELTVDLETDDEYRIGVCYTWSASSAANGRYFNARLTVDGEEVFLHDDRARKANRSTPESFFIYKQLEKGEHVLALEFRRQGKSMSVSMSNANIEIWGNNG